MKIAIANGNRRRVGGIETYLATLVPALTQSGHTVGLWHDFDEPPDRLHIAPIETLPAWSNSDPNAAIAALQSWRPDLIYCQGLTNPDLEARMLAVAPGVFFAHAYVGTCISGAKAFKRPVVSPCDRRFGPACLGQYFPRRCGGLSPVTMLRQYFLQSRRLEVLRQYHSIIVASAHMAEEYARHDLGTKTRVIELPVPNPGAEENHLPQWSAERCELLYLGRLELLKGGQLFLEALPQAQQLLKRKVRVTFAGDGPAMEAWQALAQQIMARQPAVEIRFSGWVDEAQRRDLLRAAHLLVMPSAWPEPFGLAGVEAAFFGVPAVGFNVGGIPSWLKDGVTGRLAPGQPPQPDGLAKAIADCLSDAETYARLCRGAEAAARQFSLEKHVTSLVQLFQSVVQNRP